MMISLQKGWWGMWSKYQEDVFNSVGNVVVEAKAGSGKTTTIVELCKRLKGSVLFLAFNKAIATELQKRGVPASTIHSFGLSAFRGKVDDWKIPNLCKRIGIKGAEAFKAKKAVGLWKAHMGELSWGELDDIYDLGLCAERKDAEKWDTVRAMSLRDKKVIDFDDMVYFPASGEGTVEGYDNILVDEAQDLNQSRLALIKRAVKGRLIAVGDSNQAIYGFSGAMHDSMIRIREEFDAQVLPLSICYRCARTIVREAQKWVPDIEPAQDAPEGTVNSVDSYSQAEEGDFIISRCTAPVVRAALALIRNGRTASVKGKEIGKDLSTLLQRNNVGDDITATMTRVQEYVVAEAGKLRALDREARAEMLEDKLETLIALSEGIGSVSALVGRVDSLFKDDAGGVVCMTAHKSKGLESNRVWQLGEIPHPRAKKDWQVQQESNLAYVTVTRAKKELNYVDV